MMLVCSKHVKDALKIMFIPHVIYISEQENSSAICHLCGCTAKYKVFDYSKKSGSARLATYSQGPTSTEIKETQRATAI